MNWRILILNCLFFGIVGGILSNLNCNVDDIRFWAIILCMGAIQINNSIQ